MGLRSIVHLFDRGNVCVTGLRGRGKDMLMANVACRRGLPYVSNIAYDDRAIDLDLKDLNCGDNTYKNFINGELGYYEYPFPDGTDVYISDVGVYFPSQFCNELNRDYKQIPNFMALSRQLGSCNVHINVQNLNRAWDKLREQSDTYILCKHCLYIKPFKLVLQSVRVYEKYDSCLNRLPPYRVKAPLFASPQTRLMLKLDRERYYQVNGTIKSKLLVYHNNSNYNTRIFKEMLKNGKKKNA